MISDNTSITDIVNITAPTHEIVEINRSVEKNASISTNQSAESTDQQDVENATNIFNQTELNETNMSTIPVNETQNKQTLPSIQPPAPIFDVNIGIDNVLVRGDEYLLEVKIKNIGGTARNVRAELLLPAGFSAKQSSKLCGDMKGNDICIFRTTLLVDKNTELGRKKVGVRVEYE